MTVNIGMYLSDAIMADLIKALNFIPKGRSLRLVRIPVIDFHEAINKAVTNFPFPFRPVVLNGIPVDMTENALPECVIVADDDTNIIKTAKKEIEIEVQV